MKTSKQYNSGFTLIELLVAMGIVAVLTAMAVFNFNLSRVRARDVQRKSDVSQLQKAFEVYKNDVGSYPSAAFQTDLMTGSYIKKTFSDPKGNVDWQDYVYSPAANFKSYYLMACLENPADAARTPAGNAACLIFGTDCKCGSTGSKTGAMYILSEP